MTKSKARLTIFRVVAAGILVIWLSVTALLVVDMTARTPAIAAMSLLSIFGIGAVLFGKANKTTSAIGKVLIFTAILSLITMLLKDGLELPAADSLPRVLAILTGVYLERVSPHQQLKRWMFLAIATKVQFVLVATLIASAKATDMVTILGLPTWWWLVVLMISAVPLLAFKLFLSFRIIVWFTSFMAIVLAVDVLQSQATVMIGTLAILAFVWPAITERLIGYWTYIKPVSTK